MKSGRAHPCVTLLADGRVLVTGGWYPESSSPVSTAELFDPQSNSFSSLGGMKRPRCRHSVCQLKNGQILIVSGQTKSELADSAHSLTATAELLDLDKKEFALIGQLHEARCDAPLVPYKQDRAIVFGGWTNQLLQRDFRYVCVTSAEILKPGAINP